MMFKQKQYRYPGSKPFTTEQQSIFFARENDTEKLCRMVRLEPVVVLFSRSGLGKSSLVNAGLIPVLKDTTNVQPVLIRFGAYTPTGSITPCSLTRDFIVQKHSDTSTFLDKMIPDDHSLWKQLKEIQLTRPDTSSHLLIFDQFEELFTYPENLIKDFKRELSEALNVVVPSRFRNALEQSMMDGGELLSDEEINLLNKPMSLKLLMAIRSDRLHLLNDLKDYFPEILNRNYELKALTPAQAREAILKPAQLTGENFLSPPFAIEEEAMDAILQFLTDETENSVESFQLQIICEYIEKKVIEKNLEKAGLSDIGDLNSIFKNYYDDRIRQLETPSDREAARKLIEDGLILEQEERRLSLYEGQIERDFGVKKELLERLVAAHLLRAESLPDGGYMYELAHDSLIRPVLKAKEKRKRLEVKKEEERKHQEERARERRRSRRRALLVFTVLVSIFGTVAILLSFQLNKALKEAKREKAIADTNWKKDRLKIDSLQTLTRQLQEEVTNYQNLVDQFMPRALAPETESVEKAVESISPEEAEARRQKLARQEERLDMVGKLFNSNEKERAEARNTLLRSFKEDPELAMELVDYSSGRIDAPYFNSLYQVMYILERLPLQPLQDQEKETIGEFLNRIESNSGIGQGSRTKQYLNTIRKKMQ